MALSVLREVAGCISKSTLFCIMCNECTDASNREQVVICTMWINTNLEPQEDFIWLYKVDDIYASTKAAIIKNTLTYPSQNVGDNVMMGQVLWKEPKLGLPNNCLMENKELFTYMHCYGHALNLAAGDSIRSSKLMKDALHTILGVSKLVKYSP